jgi:nitrate reductase alpha subunit
VFGDQTDVPESGDWWDASYLIMWGSNVPVTRTPDAHWMAEARYRGQKVVTVSPDYADNVKFADEWLNPHPGTDGAWDGDGPRDPQGVLRRPAGATVRRLREAVHRPAVPDHAQGEGRPTSRTSSSPPPTSAMHAEDSETPRSRPCSSMGRTGRAVVPNGSLGFRYGESGKGKWNLDLEGIDPALSLYGAGRPRASRFCRASTSSGGTRGRWLHHPRRARCRDGSAAAWSPPCST